MRSLRIVLMLLVLASALLLTACKTDGAKLIEHYEAILALIEKNGEDCEAMKEALSAYDAEHGQTIKAIWDKGDDLTGSDEEGERLSDLIVKIAAATARCDATVPGLK